MSFQVYYDDDLGMLSNAEFESLGKKVSRAIERAIGKLGGHGLGRAATGGRAKCFGSASEGPSIIATYYKTTDWLHVYLPVVRDNPGLLDSMVVHELGHRHWYQNLTSYERGRWNKKYVAASTSTIDRIQSLLRTKRYGQYRDIVEEFDSPNERLVCIHVVNALLVNKYPVKLLDQVNIKEHPATKEFATGGKLYSLIPLVSAYAREADYEDYAETFRAYVESNGSLSQLDEPSTRKVLVELFEEVSR